VETSGAAVAPDSGVAFADQGGSRFTLKHVGNTLYGDRGAPGEVLTGGMST
jgi:hypothetical protein